jgi:glycosyltransferase involved in cell wall biosynthesis
VPEGLNFEPLNVLPEKNPNPIMVFSGRLKRAKRPDHAIKAFAIVKEKVPNAQLWAEHVADSTQRNDKPDVLHNWNLRHLFLSFPK